MALFPLKSRSASQAGSSASNALREDLARQHTEKQIELRTLEEGQKKDPFGLSAEEFSTRKRALQDLIAALFTQMSAAAKLYQEDLSAEYLDRVGKEKVDAVITHAVKTRAALLSAATALRQLFDAQADLKSAGAPLHNAGLSKLVFTSPVQAALLRLRAADAARAGGPTGSQAQIDMDALNAFSQYRAVTISADYENGRIAQLFDLIASLTPEDCKAA